MKTVTLAAVNLGIAAAASLMANEAAKIYHAKLA